MTSEEFHVKVQAVLHRIEALLLEKNKHYGNSALEPIRIFSRDNAEQLLRARIDDKLSRIARGDGGETERQAREDLMGYLVLLAIAEGEDVNV